MRHRNKKVILGRKIGPKKALLQNLAASVLLYEKIKTTKGKARAVRGQVERMITLAKRKNLASIKSLVAGLPQKMAVLKAIEVLASRYEKRVGGYVRIIKLDRREGDGAEMVQLELV